MTGGRHDAHNDPLATHRKAPITNRETFERHWRRLRGSLKRQWAPLTDTELDRVGGDFEQFMGLLQTTYGFSRERAETEFGRQLAQIRDQRIEAELTRRLAKLAARHRLARQELATWDTLAAKLPLGPGGWC